MITAEQLAEIEAFYREPKFAIRIRLLLAEIKSLRAQQNNANIENNVLRVKLEKARKALCTSRIHSNPGLIAQCIDDAIAELDAL